LISPRNQTSGFEGCSAMLMARFYAESGMASRPLRPRTHHWDRQGKCGTIDVLADQVLATQQLGQRILTCKDIPGTKTRNRRDFGPPLPLRERAGVRGAGHSQSPCPKGQAGWCSPSPYPLCKRRGRRRCLARASELPSDQWPFQVGSNDGRRCRLGVPCLS